MHILIVEDSHFLYPALEEMLRNRGHQATAAKNLYQAKEYWSKYKDSIDCLIVDLNMSPDGLTEQEKEETKLGLFSGWIWLNNYVFTEKPEIKNYTIILTGHKEKLNDKLTNDNKLKLLEGLSIISKRNPSNTTSLVNEQIKQFSKLRGQI
jgi:CheY-like chemotaxis protein